MSLPSSLTVSLKRFQQASVTSVRISGDRASYASSAVMNFKLPQAGVLDLNSVALLGTLCAQASTTAIATLTTQVYNSAGFIRRVEFVVGGQVVGLNQLGDYAFAYYLSRLYTSSKHHNDFLQTSGREGSVSVPVTATATAYRYPLVVASDWLGMMGSDIRFLPLALLPAIEINVYLHDRSRWTVEDNANANTTFELQDVRLQFSKLDFDNNMLEQMWATRLNSAPIEIPFQNVSYFEGGASTSSANTFTAYVNSQSIDAIIACYRPTTYDTVYADRLVSHCGTTTAISGTTAASAYVTNQLVLNGSPLSAFQLNPADAIWQTGASLGGLGNQLYGPDVDTFDNFQVKFFALIHRLAFPTDDVDGKNWVTGMSTQGQTVPIDLVGNNLMATSKKPIIMVFSKGVMQLGAGKQIAVQL